MTARPRSRATDRIGDVLGVSAAAVGTVLLHLFLFGGDRYFSLRFLLSPVDNPISFTAFLVTLVLLAVAIVRASRARAWDVLAQRRVGATPEPEPEPERGAGSGSGLRPELGVEGRPDGGLGVGPRPAVEPGSDATAGTDVEAGSTAPQPRPPVEKELAPVAVPGAITRRALRAAAMVAVLNALFMIVFPIAVLPVSAVVFVIAATLIAATHIVLRAVAPGLSGF